MVSQIDAALKGVANDDVRQDLGEAKRSSGKGNNDVFRSWGGVAAASGHASIRGYERACRRQRILCPPDAGCHG